jgi:hypothetical protein
LIDGSGSASVRPIADIAIVMKIRIFLILVLLFFALSLVVGRVSIGLRWPERVDVSYAVSLTLLAVGGLIAAVSLFVLLQRGLNGQSLDQCLPLIIALLGGLLLYQPNWGVALALGMIATAAVATRSLGGPKRPPTDKGLGA